MVKTHHINKPVLTNTSHPERFFNKITQKCGYAIKKWALPHFMLKNSIHIAQNIYKNSYISFRIYKKNKLIIML